MKTAFPNKQIHLFVIIGLTVCCAFSQKNKLVCLLNDNNIKDYVEIVDDSLVITLDNYQVFKYCYPIHFENVTLQKGKLRHCFALINTYDEKQFTNISFEIKFTNNFLLLKKIDCKYPKRDVFGNYKTMFKTLQINKPLKCDYDSLLDSILKT